MKRDYKLFLRDLITACEDIEEFIKGPAAIKKKYPRVPWKDISGMRDRLIHGYFGVDYHLVWDTIQANIPELRASIQRILSELDNDGDE